MSSRRPRSTAPSTVPSAAVAVLCCALVACTPPVGPVTAGPSDDHAVVDGTTDPAPPASAVHAEVVRVVDGDTVLLEIDGVRERVRLLRVDTPELERDDQPEECLAAEATAALERLLPPGEPVLVATDVEPRDRFGRLLAHVWTTGTWVNAQLLRDGVAQVVTFPPNTAYDEELLAAQSTARDAGVGLWDEAACD